MEVRVAKSYRSQYLDPRWQKKRLQALEFYGFSCILCGEDEKTLHVHHKQYVPNKDVWDYSICQLDVLCAECHLQSHDELEFLNEVIGLIPTLKVHRYELACLIAGYCGINIDEKLDSPLNKLTYQIGQLAEQQKVISRKFYYEQIKEADKNED